MKRKLLLAALCVVGALSLHAQNWTSGVEVAAGEYYLYNVGADRFLNRGGTYTTHAIADGQGVVVTLAASDGGTYTVYTGVNNKYLNVDYTDGDAYKWTFEKVNTTTNAYTLKGENNQYLYWVGGGDGFWGNEVLNANAITEGSENNFYWLLIPKATRQDLASASTTSPLDVTYLVSNPDFEYQIRDTPWKNDDEAKPWNGDWGKTTSGWTNTNFWRQQSSQTFANGIFFEKYNGDGLTTADKIYQNVTLQAGTYRLTCTGHARCTEYYLYASDATAHITDAGTYTVNFEVTENGQVEIGTKIVAGGTGDWVAFDNVRLYSTGLYIAAVAEELPANGAMAANQWYKVVVANDAEYTISATTPAAIIVTTNGSQYVSEATGDVLTTGDAVNLTAGTYYYKSTSANTLTVTINDPIQPQRDIITAQKGDITSLVNGTFQDNVNGWTGGSHITWVTGRGWRGDNATKFYETNKNGALSYTLSNMPAGTYKVVAAARGYDGGKITPEIAGTKGTTLNCVGDARSDKSTSEINTNGVEMPYSELGGFTTDANGHNWKWITATGTLAADGDLVINFNCEGTSWMCIDDVHLYCTELAGTSYTTSVGVISANMQVTNTDDRSVVTCDLVMSNPNAMIYPTGGVITTAAGQTMNNNMVYVNGSAFRVANMILYDGYPFTIYNNKSYYFTSATLYRKIPANTWCTLNIPFWPTTSLTKKYPSSFNDETGVLSFAEVEKASWGNDKPMLIKSESEINAISGVRAGSGGGGNVVTNGDMTSGSGVPMQGVYEAGKVPVSDADTYYYYIDATDGMLHKVTGNGVNIAPFRAYFSLSQAVDAPMRSTINLDFDGDATGISLVADKTVEENKVYFNLNGQRVATPTKGIYIVNGKKVYVK